MCNDVYTLRLERELTRLETWTDSQLSCGVEVDVDGEEFDNLEMMIAEKCRGDDEREVVLAAVMNECFGIGDWRWRNATTTKNTANHRDDISTNMTNGDNKTSSMPSNMPSTNNIRHRGHTVKDSPPPATPRRRGCRVCLRFNSIYLRHWGLSTDKLRQLTARQTPMTIHHGNESNATQSSDVIASFLIELYDDYPFYAPSVACLHFHIPWIEHTLKSVLPLTFTEKVLLCEQWTPCITLVTLCERLGSLVRQSFAEELCFVSPSLNEPTTRSPSKEDIKTTSTTFASNIHSFFSVLHSNNMRNTPVIFVFVIALALRLLNGLQKHSGEYNAPDYGDYEAHRHWMEITTNVPVKYWYVQTPQNDLSYWGIDYPPLSAYHAWIFGNISNFIDRQSMILHQSRGFLTPTHKVFMRWTVIISEMICMWPALYLYWTRLIRTNTVSYPGGMICLLLFLSAPPMVVIDHSHFQYNNVALGLVVFAFHCFSTARYLTCVGAFCFSILFKQTMFYFAPPFAAAMLGIVTHSVVQKGLLRQQTTTQTLYIASYRLLAFAITTIISIFIVFLPFLTAFINNSHHISNQESTKTHLIILILRRIFPVGRGLYEDYVANFWVSVNPIFRFKQLCDVSSSHRDVMAVVSLLLTLGAQTKTCWACFIRPTPRRLLAGMFCSSLSFYLFSFQVHEKAIMLPTLVALLALPYAGYGSCVFVLVSSYSVWHLAVKDYMLMSVVTQTILWGTFALSVVHLVNETTEGPNYGPHTTSTSWVADFVDVVLSPFLTNSSRHKISKMFFKNNCQNINMSSKNSHHNQRFTSKTNVFIHRHQPSWSPISWRPTSVQLTNFFKVTTFLTVAAGLALQLARMCIATPASKPFLFEYLDCVFCCVFFLVALVGVSVLGVESRAWERKPSEVITIARPTRKK